MPKKPIKIKSLASIESTKSVEHADELIDQWVNENENSAITKNADLKSTEIKETRFTVVIPTFLHKRIKKYCAAHSISMKTKLVELFEENFPET